MERVTNKEIGKAEINYWPNGKGISLELPSHGGDVSLRQISYGHNRIGMTILQIEELKGNQWPVIEVPTLSDLERFNKALIETYSTDKKQLRILKNAKTQTEEAIYILRKSADSSY